MTPNQIVVIVVCLFRPPFTGALLVALSGSRAGFPFRRHRWIVGRRIRSQSPQIILNLAAVWESLQVYGLRWHVSCFVDGLSRRVETHLAEPHLA